MVLPQFPLNQSIDGQQRSDYVSVVFVLFWFIVIPSVYSHRIGRPPQVVLGVALARP
jgi:hypothetical protein